MIPVRVSRMCLYRLMLSASECKDLAIRYSGGRRETPAEQAAHQLFAVMHQADRHPDDTRTFEVPEDLLEALAGLIPTVLVEHENDPAEMSALIDAWPEELEEVQAELLAALGRSSQRG